MPISKTYNVDCLEWMKSVADKAFDLAIVDPPYGIGIAKKENAGGQTSSKKWANPSKKSYKKGDWDNQPAPSEYFQELFRISQNQIIWGANHFIDLINKNSACWIVWDKITNGNLADCELAWTSFNTSIRRISLLWNGFARCEQVDRIHINQKPVKLYKWLLTNYAKDSDRVFDSHLGSQSSRIAAYDLGFDFEGCELDRDYFEQGNERFERHIKQASLFTPELLPSQSQLFESI